MKTVSKWIKTLPEPYRSEAMENTKRFGTYRNKDISLSEALRGAFMWEGTIEGFDYWEDISNRAADGEFDEVHK